MLRFVTAPLEELNKIGLLCLTEIHEQTTKPLKQKDTRQ